MSCKKKCIARLYTGYFKQKAAGESEGKQMCHNYVGGGKGSDVKGFRIYFGFLRSPGILPLVLLIIKFNEMHFKRHSLMPRGIP